MLRSLHIENYALIRSLQIQFDKGLTVITGETGAGKSILMGALSLILGNRADTSVLFDKSKKCSVEAIFDIKNISLASFFEQNDLDYQDNTIIRREITESGKSRAFINDTPVNLTVLKALASRLIDIHSQHQNLLFQNEDFRMEVVDEFAQIRQDVVSYRSVFKEFKQAENELAELLARQREHLEKQDFLQFVYDELSAANLLSGEQEELEQDIDFLSHTETIKDHCFQMAQLLSESEGSVLNQLHDVRSLSSQISSYHPNIKTVNERLESAFIELKDLSNEIMSLNNKVDYDPELLERKRQRLDLLNSLQLKHHVSSVEALLEKRDSIQQELSAFTNDEQAIAQLKGRCEQLKADAQERAAAISKKRKAVLTALQDKILEKARQLGMPDAQFVIRLEQNDTLQKNGIDSVSYLFSANKGVAVAELEKVVSGGEMSRLMLAVKSVISDRSVLPTVVFDEIDTGISGEMAGKVAKLMKEMSQARQLLVITHLPQIAAKGTTHYQVFKQLIAEKSHTQVRKLEPAERIEEIAKMMSGDACGDAALQAAKELIEQ
ncbi:MAG: DNA repair protein RecN [Bacteroidales bacterium]|nr:DNA repair protein RecN [Bacteroidales bacterium]